MTEQQARETFMNACARLRALEQGRDASLRRSWILPSDIRDYDRQVRVARQVRDEAHEQLRLFKVAPPRRTRVVRLG